MNRTNAPQRSTVVVQRPVVQRSIVAPRSNVQPNAVVRRKPKPQSLSTSLWSLFHYDIIRWNTFTTTSYPPPPQLNLSTQSPNSIATVLSQFHTACTGHVTTSPCTCNAQKYVDGLIAWFDANGEKLLFANERMESVTSSPSAGRLPPLSKVLGAAHLVRFLMHVKTYLDVQSMGPERKKIFDELSTLLVLFLKRSARSFFAVPPVRPVKRGRDDVENINKKKTSQDANVLPVLPPLQELVNTLRSSHNGQETNKTVQHALHRVKPAVVVPPPPLRRSTRISTLDVSKIRLGSSSSSSDDDSSESGSASDDSSQDLIRLIIKKKKKSLKPKTNAQPVQEKDVKLQQAEERALRAARRHQDAPAQEPITKPSNNVVCHRCHKDDNGTSLLLCDGKGCRRAFHMGCLTPPLEGIPLSDWYCPYCSLELVSSPPDSLHLFRHVQMFSPRSLLRKKTSQ